MDEGIKKEMMTTKIMINRIRHSKGTVSYSSLIHDLLQILVLLGFLVPRTIVHFFKSLCELPHTVDD
jgi:hypothetical protein